MWPDACLYRSGMKITGSPGGPTSGAECVCVKSHQIWRGWMPAAFSISAQTWS